MERINILNKSGMLTDEDRKETLVRSYSYLQFETWLDLSKPIKITLHFGDKILLKNYNKDLMNFMVFWSHFISKDLNGFNLSSVTFEPIEFEIITK